MADFVCRALDGSVLARYPETTLEQDLRRCAQLILETENVETIRVADRKLGASAQLQGRWTDSARQLLETGEAAPELKQEVVFEQFPDRYAHSVVHQTWVQRADFICGLIENADFDDREKFNQRLLRDMSAAIRALVGDVLDLQTQLGAALQRIDNLETYTKTGDENFHSLPGSTSNENSAVQPLPSPPYYIGSELISDEREQKLYHQGVHVGGVDGGLRRYFAAQESRGIAPPPISPIAVADETTEIYERFDQGAIAPDGGPRCRAGETRGGFAEEADCSGGDDGLDFPVPVQTIIPIITTPFYVPQAYNTGEFVLNVGGGILSLAEGYIIGEDNEVFHHVNNPLCNPPDPSTPKCIPALYWPQPFVPQPPYPDDGPCGPPLTLPCI